jgi:hypothetical protein
VNRERSFRDLAVDGLSAFRDRRLLEATLLGLAWFLPLLAAGLVLGIWLRFRPLGGWLMLAFTTVGVLLGVMTAVRFGLRHHLGRVEFLRLLERRLALGENELVVADEMESSRDRLDDPLARGLAGLAVDRGVKVLAAARVRELAPAVSLRGPASRAGAGFVVVLLLYFAAPAAWIGALSRLARPGSHELLPALAIRVDPGNATVERGSRVTVRAGFGGNPVSAPLLLQRAPGGAWKSVPMVSDSAAGPGSFRAEIPPVLEAIEYAVAAGPARSDLYRLRVIEALRATGYRKRLEFPAYTHLAPAQELGADGSVSGLEGARVTLTVYPSRPGARGRLLPGDAPPIPLQPAGGGELAGSYILRRSFSYRVELESDAPSRARWVSDPFAAEAVPDRPPVLFQLSPERNIILPPDQAVILELDCADDFGLTKCELVYRRGDDPSRRARVAAWSETREARISFPWSMTDLSLVPGDRVRYHLELTDNDAFDGPNTTVGPEGEIRFPSLDEMYASLDEERTDQLQQVKEAMEKQKDVSRDLDKVRSEMRQNKDFRWENQEQVKDLADRQATVARQVEDLARSMEQSLERMEQGSLFTPELVEKVQQINELVQQIQSPEFRERMEQLQQAMQKLDRSAVQRALDQMQVTQEELARSLDRTLEMLKQIQREENLDRMIQQAESLIKEQQQINEQLQGEKKQGEQDSGEQKPGEQKPGEQDQGEKKDGQPSDSTGAGEEKPGSVDAQPLTPEQAQKLQERQQALKQELEKLRAETEKLAQDAQKNWPDLQKQMEEKQSPQELTAASKSMEQASKSMGSCQKKNSLKFGREAKKSLQSFAQGMRSAQQQLSKKDQEEVTRMLYAISGRLVGLSRDQEELLRTGPARSTRELARDQQLLTEGARRTLDQLYELGRKSRFITPQLGQIMGEAVRNLDSARQEFMDGARPGGMQAGTQAGQALDGTVMALLAANESMCSGSCSSSCNNPLARMRSLSGQQEGLNSDMQASFGQGQGGQRLSSGSSGQDQLASMAARQEMIRQGLQEVQQSLGDQSGVLGRLGDIGKEMEELVQEMRHRGVDERVLRRQERILSRLLTAQKSLRQEGQKEERVSRTGQPAEGRLSPADYSSEPDPAEALRRGILRGGRDPVPGEFRRLVETYFRSLGAPR